MADVPADRVAFRGVADPETVEAGLTTDEKQSQRTERFSLRAERRMGQINQLTEQIIGCAMTVHSRLGPGLLESAYQKCLEYELLKAGLQVEYEKPIPLVYDNLKLECGYRIDLLVQGLVIVEVKAKDEFHPVDFAQLLSYLRLSNLQVGLLINFHSLRLKDGIKRLVNNYKE